MKRMLTAVGLAAVFAGIAHAQNIAGDWQGTLKAGDAELRLVLHVTTGDDGNLKATLDSLDQGASGIPVTSITLKDAKLSLEVQSVHGTYEGKVDAAGTTIERTWSQGQPLPLTFKRGGAAAKPPPKPAKPTDIDGTWGGTLDTGTAKLRVVFHLTNTEEGLMATLDSPDQNAKGIPITAVTRTGSSLTLEVKSIGGRFEGKIGGDVTAIEGTWTQGGASLPLLLKRPKDGA